MAAPGKTGRAGILGGGALIFVTIGSALPFDRLVQAMDDWARDNPGEDILAQTGDGVFEPPRAWRSTSAFPKQPTLE